MSKIRSCRTFARIRDPAGHQKGIPLAASGVIRDPAGTPRDPAGSIRGHQGSRWHSEGSRWHRDPASGIPLGHSEGSRWPRPLKGSRSGTQRDPARYHQGSRWAPKRDPAGIRDPAGHLQKFYTRELRPIRRFNSHNEFVPTEILTHIHNFAVRTHVLRH